MEVQEEQGTGLLSDEDILLVECLTSELINKALDLCDEKVNSFDEIIESRTDLPQGGDRSLEDLAEETSGSNDKKKLEFLPSQNCRGRSNSAEVRLTFHQTLSLGENYVTPSWRRSLRRTQSEAALSLVDEDIEIEYLEHFDPFKGNLDVVSHVDEVLATSANKHPAEQTSFLQALEEMSGEPRTSCKMTDEKSRSVCFDCATSDEVDDTDVVDGGFAGRENGLAESMKSQEPLFSTSAIAGIHNNDIPTSASRRNDNESCSADTDIENRRLLNFENSTERTSTADSDCRNNIVMITSVIDQDATPNHTNDRVMVDISDRVTDDTGDRVIDDTGDRVTDDTSDRVTDDTSDRVTDDTSDRVTHNTNDTLTDITNDKATDDSCIVESISPTSLLNIQASEDSSTCNCMTSTNLKSSQDNFIDPCILPKPPCANVTLKSVTSDAEDVSKTDGRHDLKATDANQFQPVDLNETVSDVDGLVNLSFLSTDTGTDFSSFSSAEKFVKEILSRSRSSSSTSSPRKSCGAAINADSRMYNTLTFLDNDDSDDGEGGGTDRKNKTTEEATDDGNEKLDNHKHPASDVNDNPRETAEENGSAVTPTDSEPTAAKKKIVPNFELLKCDDLDLNFSPRGSVPDLHLGDYYNDHTPDDLDSPDDLANPVFDSIDDWGDDLNDPPVEPIPEYTAREEYEDVRNWRPVQIAGISYRIDMRAIEPYKKVLSHGGYYGNGLNAIVVFAACYLPDRSRLDYRYIMDNLFLYVVSVLELLVVEDYMIIYFHAATSRNKVPALRWLKRCYDMIDHRLRKNLQRLLVVHPTFFLKTVVIMTKPFISSKFSSKLHYVRSLAELTRLVPTEYIHLPDEVKEADRSLNPNTPAPQKKFINL